MAMSRSFGATSFMSLPSIYSSPPEISSSPATILRVVVFPQPEGPTRTTNSLSLIVRFALSTALTPPSYTLVMFLSSTVAIGNLLRLIILWINHKTEPGRCQRKRRPGEAERHRDSLFLRGLPVFQALFQRF